MAFAYQAQSIPAAPGCYLYRDAQGRVIYVGKAVDLRARTRSYFQDPSRLSPKNRALVSRIGAMETIVTASELEALILECTLIKKFRPKYNILLRDDKTYPYLCLTDEPYPRLVVTRQPRKGLGRLYGPFVDVGAMRATQRLILRQLGIRQCKIEIDRSLARPCLYHAIGQCGAPCVAWGESQQDYAAHVRQARAVLEGRESALLDELKAQMAIASEALQFEAAARLRDSIQAVETVRARQAVVLPEPRDVDVAALAFRQTGFAAAEGESGRLRTEACVQLFFIRAGKLCDRQVFRLSNLEGADPGEVLEAFVTQYYAAGAVVPEEVVLQHPVAEPAVMADWLSGRRGQRVRLTVPQRGEKLALVRLVEENARQSLEAAARSASEAPPEAPARDLQAGLDELTKVFNLPGPPHRVEGFDISHVQGSHTVASMVVMLDGRAAPSEYRRYRIKTVKGVDDFASMREVVGRRYRRVLDEGLPLPDLVMIDGGKGQLGAALAALKALGLERLPAFGLAKRLEEFFVPGREASIRLGERSAGRLMVQRLRDEAHRFAIAYHRRLRSKAISLSELDEVPGLGPALKKRLLAAFGGLQGLKSAPLSGLLSVKGVGEDLAARLHAHLQGSKPGDAANAGDRTGE
jgi:excinuclease ABC subunit C